MMMILVCTERVLGVKRSWSQKRHLLGFIIERECKRSPRPQLRTSKEVNLSCKTKFWYQKEFNWVSKPGFRTKQSHIQLLNRVLVRKESNLAFKPTSSTKDTKEVHFSLSTSKFQFKKMWIWAFKQSFCTKKSQFELKTMLPKTDFLPECFTHTTPLSFPLPSPAMKET